MKKADQSACKTCTQILKEFRSSLDSTHVILQVGEVSALFGERCDIAFFLEEISSAELQVFERGGTTSGLLFQEVVVITERAGQEPESIHEVVDIFQFR